MPILPLGKKSLDRLLDGENETLQNERDSAAFRFRLIFALVLSFPVAFATFHRLLAAYERLRASLERNRVRWRKYQGERKMPRGGKTSIENRTEMEVVRWERVGSARGGKHAHIYLCKRNTHPANCAAAHPQWLTWRLLGHRFCMSIRVTKDRGSPSTHETSGSSSNSRLLVDSWPVRVHKDLLTAWSRN